MNEGAIRRYRALVDKGAIQADGAQALAAEKLTILASRLARHKPPSGVDILSFLTRRKNQAPEGLYIFGAVGRGKTMLMDLFFATVDFAPKRRVHFHAFMSDVHARIAKTRKRDPGDPIPLVAEAIAKDAQLLCLDELQVNDIADAMILSRLFEHMFKANVIAVATSNSAPGDLYPDGLNRPLFEPFIKLIEEKMEVFELESPNDYRLNRLKGADLYFSPLNAEARKAMDKAFSSLTGTADPDRTELAVGARKLTVPASAMGVARFAFDDLCEQPLGASDYAEIARAFHTVLIDDVPVLTPERRNAARRFISLIDVLYDNGAGLIASAEAEPDALYPKGDGHEAFARTASRLMEMRSEAYLSDRRREAHVGRRRLAADALSE